MQLKELLKYVQVKETVGNTDIQISGLCTDSQKVQSGDLFFCFAGAKHD